MINIKYPGKLFLLGEYSIMESGNSAFIYAVDRYLIANIKESDSLLINSDYGTISSTSSSNKDMEYVLTAYEVALDYLKLKNIPIKTFELNLISELNNKENKKYGFGSSGVVIVTTLDAILKFHEISIDKLTLFKLAVVTQKRMNKLSSGGDLAASIYGGIIFYTRYDTHSVSTDVACVKEKWPLLKIETIETPYNIEIAWTKKSHDTNIALENYKRFKEKDPNKYQSLIKEANTIVLEAYENDDISDAIDKYRDWMLKLQSILNYEIETPELTNLIESAKDLGYKAKVSGSGGGDCGFLISKKHIDTHKVKETWKNLDLEYIEKGE